MDYGHIKKRDSGYVITKNGLPYWVPREDKEWESVQEYATAHPECVTEESPYVPPVPTTEELAASVRAERNRRLATTDYLVMPDYPLSTDKLEEIKAYRQALRDLPQQPGFPWNGPDDPACPWPVIPTLNR